MTGSAIPLFGDRTKEEEPNDLLQPKGTGGELPDNVEAAPSEGKSLDLFSDNDGGEREALTSRLREAYDVSPDASLRGEIMRRMTGEGGQVLSLPSPDLGIDEKRIEAEQDARLLMELSPPASAWIDRPENAPHVRGNAKKLSVWDRMMRNLGQAGSGAHEMVEAYKDVRRGMAVAPEIVAINAEMGVLETDRANLEERALAAGGYVFASPEIKGKLLRVERRQAELAKKLEALQAEPATGVYSAAGEAAKMATGSFRVSVLGWLQGALEGAIAGTGIGGGLTLATGGTAAPSIPAFAAKGALVGGTARAAYHMARLERALAYGELRNIPGIDPEDALIAADLVGAANGMLEYVGFRMVAQTIPGLRGLVARRAVVEIMRDQTRRGAFMRAVRGLGKAMAGEGATEFLQEVSNIVAQRTIEPETEDPTGKYTWNTFYADFGRAADAAWAAAQATFFLAGAGSTMSYVQDARRAGEAARRMDIFKAMADEAVDLDMMPLKAQQFIRAVREGGPVQEIGIPVVEFDAYWQAQVENEQTRQAVYDQLGVSDQVADARQTGGDVVIKIEDVITKLAPTPHMGPLFQHMRIGDDVPTMAEASADAELFRQELDRVIQEAGRIVEEVDVLDVARAEQDVLVREKMYRAALHLFDGDQVKADAAASIMEAHARALRENYGVMDPSEFELAPSGMGLDIRVTEPGQQPGPAGPDVGAPPGVPDLGQGALRSVLAGKEVATLEFPAEPSPPPQHLGEEQAAAWRRVPDIAERVKSRVEEVTGQPAEVSLSDGAFGRSWYVYPRVEYTDGVQRVVRISDHSAAPRTTFVEARVDATNPEGVDSQIEQAAGIVSANRTDRGDTLLQIPTPPRPLTPAEAAAQQRVIDAEARVTEIDQQIRDAADAVETENLGRPPSIEAIKVENIDELNRQRRQAMADFLNANQELDAVVQGQGPEPTLFQRTDVPIQGPGAVIAPSAPDPTAEERAAAVEDTRKGGRIVQQRLNVIVPESRRVIGGAYTVGAPDGRAWSDLSEDELATTGPGFQGTQADLDRMWEETVSEVSLAAQQAVESTGAAFRLTPEELDAALSLPLRAQLWYELSAEKFRDKIAPGELTTQHFLMFADLIGATSARSMPFDNLARSLAVLSEYLRQAPIDIDLSQPSTVRAALARRGVDISNLDGNKTAMFSNTLALTAGATTQFPIPVNDVWVGRMFGVSDAQLTANQSLHEAMALFQIKLAEFINARSPDQAIPHQSWHTQARTWVEMRPQDEANDYAQEWDHIIRLLNDAGVPGLDGDVITMDALMAPEFAPALRGTLEAFRAAPKATIEFGTTQTDVGSRAAELYGVALEAGDEITQREYLQTLTSTMYDSSRGATPWQALARAVTGQALNLTRIERPTASDPLSISGTFEGAVSPNIRIPMRGMRGGETYILSDEEIRAFNAYAGRALRQDAMATSHILYEGDVPAGYISGYSIYVPTTEAISPDEIRAFARALPEGHEVISHRDPGGYVLDITPAFGEDGPIGIDESALDGALDATLRLTHSTHAIDTGFRTADYTEAADYEAVIAAYEEKLRGEAIQSLLDLGVEQETAEGIVDSPDPESDPRLQATKRGEEPAPGQVSSAARGRARTVAKRWARRLGDLQGAERQVAGLQADVEAKQLGQLEAWERRLQRAGALPVQTLEQPGRRPLGEPGIENERDVAFQLLAEAQRDAPERAMIDVQTANGGGVLNFVAEHVGDITNRMSERFSFFNGMQDTVFDKVDKTLRALEREYGFAREHEENLRINAEYRGVSYEEHKAGVDAALQRYADAHRALTTHNEAQEHAKMAAVSIGEQDWAGAILHLRALKRMEEDGTYAEEAAKFDGPVQTLEQPAAEIAQRPDVQERLKDTAVREEDGSLRPVFHGTNATDIKGGFRPGSHFGTAEAANERFGDLADFSVEVVGRDPGIFQTIPVYLNIKNPLRMPDMADVWEDGSTGRVVLRAQEEETPREFMGVWEELDEPDMRTALLDEEQDLTARAWEGEEDVSRTLLEMGVIDIDEFEDHRSFDEGLMRLLEEKGYDGIVYRNTVEDAGQDSYIIFRPEQVVSAITGQTLEQQRPPVAPGPKGRINFSDGASVIDLFKGRADVSTIMHEMSHLWLRELVTMAGQGNVAAQQDLQVVRGWLTRQGQTVGDFFDVTQEEMFADAGEAYAFEGRTPSIELAGVMDRFRAWMRHVYMSVRQILDRHGIEMDDEIRAVFDRLMATTAEIEEAEASAGTRPLSPDMLEAIGLTPEEAAEYNEAVASSRRAAEADVIKRRMAEIKRMRDADMRQARDGFVAQVEAEMAEDQRYQALRALADQVDVATGETLPNRIKIDREGLRQLEGVVGGNILSSMPRGRELIYEEGGLPPADVAAMFGFADEVEMVEQLAGLTPYRKAVNLEVARRMEPLVAEHREAVREGNVVNEAMDALHNDDRARFVDVEYRALSRRSALESKTAREAAKAAAKEAISRRTVALATKANGFLVAERKAFKAAEQAILAENWAEATRQKHLQLLNAEMYAESRRVAAEVERAHKRLRDVARKKSVRDAIASDYRDQIDKILEQVDLRQSVPRADRQEIENIGTWMQGLVSDGIVVDIPDSVLNRTETVHWRNMSLSQFRDVADAVDHLRHLGRLKNKLIKSRDQRAFDTIIEEAVEHIYANNERLQPGAEFGRSISPATMSRARQMWESLKTVDVMVNIMDGFEDGPLHDLFIRPMADAQDVEETFQKEIAVKYGRIWDLYSRSERAAWGTRADRIRVEGVLDRNGKTLTLHRLELLMIALNAGNPEGREALLGGRNWTEADLEAILMTLDERDVQFVQGMWDILESMRERLFEHDKAFTGYEPIAVEAIPVETRFGTLPGGYFPIKYDPQQGWTAHRNEEREMQEGLMGGHHAHAHTQRGAMKARTSRLREDGKIVPLKISPDVIHAHFNQVIHDYAFRGPVVNALKTLNDPRMRQAIVETQGREVYNEMQQWVRKIAGEYRPTHAWEGIARTINNNASVALLGWSLLTMSVQVTSITSAISYLATPGRMGTGEKALAIGIKQFLGNPVEAIKFARESSNFIRMRTQNRERDTRQVMQRMGPASIKNLVATSAFHFIGLADLSISIPIWHAGYQKSYVASMEAIRARGDLLPDTVAVLEAKAHEDAVHAGDQAVRRSQGTGETFARANMQDGSAWWQTMTKFMSYFVAHHNNLVRIGAMKAKGISTWPETVAYILWATFMPAVLEGLMRGGPSEDDEETTEGWMARKVGEHLVGGIPMARDIWGVVDSELKGKPGFEVSTPALDLLTHTGRAMGSLGQVLTDEQKDELTRTELRSGVYALGYAFGIPAAQPWRWIDAYMAKQEGYDVSDYELFFKGYRRPR